eukprot:scaffold7052_cov254-Pinguiococcus_pyrenoidosus.AAC.53
MAGNPPFQVEGDFNMAPEWYLADTWLDWRPKWRLWSVKWAVQRRNDWAGTDIGVGLADFVRSASQTIDVFPATPGHVMTQKFC